MTQTAANEPTKRKTDAAPDAIALLKADHAEVHKLYKQYQKLVDQKADADTRATLAGKICQALTVHASIEEEIFYPAAREVIDDANVLDHADVEHASAKALIAQIESMHADETHYDAKVCVLCEYISHHVSEEEEELFPKVRRKLDLKALGETLAARKAELTLASAREVA